MEGRSATMSYHIEGFGTPKVTWDISDGVDYEKKYTASIDGKGRVSGRKFGTATVTMKFKDIKKRAKVHVTRDSSNSYDGEGRWVQAWHTDPFFDRDKTQGIWVSQMHALQRHGGYNDFYDEAFDWGEILTSYGDTVKYAIVERGIMGFFHDFFWKPENIKTDLNTGSNSISNTRFKAQFAYNPTTSPSGFRYWRIEGWKGNYWNMGVGAEIGIYQNAESPDAHYYSAEDNQRRPIMFDLYESKPISKRVFYLGPTRHWWLAGFKPGIGFMDKNETCLDGYIDFENKGFAAKFGSTVRNSEKSWESLSEKEIKIVGTRARIVEWQ
jgi:hypothetical protein